MSKVKKVRIGSIIDFKFEKDTFVDPENELVYSVFKVVRNETLKGV